MCGNGAAGAAGGQAAAAEGARERRVRESGEEFTRLFEDVEELFVGDDARTALPKQSGRQPASYDEPPTRRHLGGYRTAARRTRLSAIGSAGGGADSGSDDRRWTGRWRHC